MLDIKDEISQYDYIKYISLTWINPEQYWSKTVLKPKNSKLLVETFTIIRVKSIVVASDVNACSSTSSKNKAIIIYATMHPSNVILSYRLNTSLQHLTKATNVKRSRCQLHRWSRGIGGKGFFASVMTCSIFRVTLCVAFM